MIVTVHEHPPCHCTWKTKDMRKQPNPDPTGERPPPPVAPPRLRMEGHQPLSKAEALAIARKKPKGPDSWSFWLYESLFSWLAPKRPYAAFDKVETEIRDKVVDVGDMYAQISKEVDKRMANLNTEAGDEPKKYEWPEFAIGPRPGVGDSLSRAILEGRPIGTITSMEPSDPTAKGFEQLGRAMAGDTHALPPDPAAKIILGRPCKDMISGRTGTPTIRHEHLGNYVSYSVEFGDGVVHILPECRLVRTE